jgi:hypothetical protein
MQLRFASLTVTSSRVDFHLQVNAHAGRTYKKARSNAGFFFPGEEAAGTLQPGRNGVIVAVHFACLSDR